MCIRDRGYILSLKDVLPQFMNIKNRINVTEDAFIEHLAEPVSYTHLDVYKRQSARLRDNRSTVA